MLAAGPSRYLFTLLGTPIRAEVGAVFLVVMLLSTTGANGPLGMVVAVPVTVVALLSLLAHELGHAGAVRALGYGRSEIVIGFMGGYCRWNGTPRPAHRMGVALAGPAVSLALSAVGFGLIAVTPDAAMSNPFVGSMIVWLARVNLFWGVFNLLPIHPMDGGQALRAALQIFWRGAQPVRASLVLSMVTALALGVLAIRSNLWVAGLLLGYMAWMNYAEMQRIQRTLRLAP